jgi:hypothetical protein
MLIWPLFVVGYNAQSMLNLSHFVYEIRFKMKNSKEQKYNETLSIISPVQCFLGRLSQSHVNNVPNYQNIMSH